MHGRVTSRYLVGVDLGTSSTKSALYRVDGVEVATAVAEVPISNPQPGVVEQSCHEFYSTAARTVQQCIRESGVDPRQIAAIAFDSQMAGLGAIDENGDPAMPFDSWLDMRCQPYIASLDREHGDLITGLTGCPPTCDHGPKMLWWKEERPEIYGRIAKFLMPAAYVAMKLTGLKAAGAFIDYTFIHFSALSDAIHGCWSDQLCGLLGVARTKLPRIVEPWHVAGTATDRAARDFGLAPGTIVAAGCGDTAAGALGAGITRPGMLFDVAGTASVLAGSTAEYVADRQHRALLTMRSIMPGLWHPLAYIGGGGLALRWFRDQFFNRSRGAPLAPSDDLYSRLSDLAASAPPGAGGLLFSPHLGGRICPAAPQMRGAWLGFSWGHTQAHFARAIMESVAYEYAYYLSVLRTLVPDLELTETRVVGGGAASAVWNQIKADVLGVPYQPLRGAEFGTWGAAVVAARAAGLGDDLGEIAHRAVRPAGGPTLPNENNAAIYRSAAQQYVAWQECLRSGFQGEHE
jgi:xylulokinase